MLQGSARVYSDTFFKDIDSKHAVEAYRLMRSHGSHMFYTVGSQIAVRLSALHAGHPLTPGRFLVLISLRG
jgi:hypothetical protein